MDRGSGCNTLPKNFENFKVNDQSIFKIKLALSSLTNSVILCPMVANLYTQSANDDETWTYYKRGVPGIILNYDKDKVVISLLLCIADPDSGFAIWREPLLPSSDYKASQNNFHTFKLTSSSECMAGIRFPLEDGANIFLHDVLNNMPKASQAVPIPEPENQKHQKSKSIWKGSSIAKRKISKAEISRPCMYTHVAGGTLTQTIEESSNSKTKSNSKSTSKQSGSGSSIDHPDADPSQVVAVRRSLHNTGV